MGKKKYTGPKKLRRTGKRGFFVGLALGVLAWYLQRDPNSSLTPTVLGIVGVLTGLSVILQITGYVRGKASLGTFGDGLVYGLTTGFDIASFLNVLASGNAVLQK